MVGVLHIFSQTVVKPRDIVEAPCSFVLPQSTASHCVRQTAHCDSKTSTMHRPSDKVRPSFHTASHPPKHPPMCKIHIPPLHHKPTPKHDPTTPPTHAPIPTSSSKFQKPTRKMSLPRTFCLSSASAALTPSTSLTAFTNHYEVMKLDPSASTDDVKAQFRKLRAEYFAADASKYRQLQTAYAVLVDEEARREYDALYRASTGLSSRASEVESSGSALLRRKALVKAAVEKIDAQTQQAKVEEELRRVEEDEEQRRREADPNWGLKHFSPAYAPLIGSEPYHSFVPVAVEYDVGEKKRRRSRRPTYVGEIAAKAVP